MYAEKEKVINVWDKVASNFGKTGPKYWDDFGNRLIELSNIQKSATVLDVGMGRGASLFPAIKKAGKYGHVIGIDNSEVMVNETYKDILDSNICNATVKKMNAQSLNFKEEYFDNVICGFGIGYLLCSENKLSDILSVLKHGGQAGFSIWGVQEDQKWLTEIIQKYLKTDLKNSNSKQVDILKFDNVGDVIKILYDSGFENIKVHEEDSEVVYTDKDDWWEEMLNNAVRGIFDEIEKLGSEVYAQFKAEIFNGLEKFKRGDGLHFNMPVIYAFGDKK